MRLAEEWRGSRHPPGSYPYQDPMTGFNYPNDGGMTDRIAAVQKHRRANPTVYPPSDAEKFDAQFIQGQIESYICERRPELCGEAPALRAHITHVELPSDACVKCGHTNWEAVYCRSCGGSRVEGYRCKNCSATL